MDKKPDILSLFDSSGFGLEIGPSFNPACPKSQGFNVETLDHASQDDLVRKYSGVVDTTRIEPVDYVSDGRPMREIIGEAQRYDFIIARHVIEHTVDLVGFFRDCQSLLKDEGVLVLAVPDKRFCFDYFRPWSTTGRALEIHRQGRSRHSFASVFDHFAYACRSKADRKMVWRAGQYFEKELVNDTLDRASKLAAETDSGTYVDTHAWQFTPHSFRLIVEELNSIGLMSLKEVRGSWDTGLAEFRVVLSRSGQGSCLTRLELMTMAYQEAVTFEDRFRTKQDHEPDVDMSEALAQAQALADKYKRDRDALLASRSWKLTKPLRAVQAKIGRYRRN